MLFWSKILNVTSIIFNWYRGHGISSSRPGYLYNKTILKMTIITANTAWDAKTGAPVNNNTLLGKWNLFMESQAERITLWFLVSLLFQGVLILPVPAALIYYANAPVAVLAVTLTLFFANIIAGMGGAGIKTLLWLFAASVMIHLLMILIFII